MDKSHVAMEQKVCVVCTKQYDTGAILLNKALRKTLENPTVSGVGVCPEHQKLHEGGYIALIEIDPDKSTNISGNIVKQEDAYRTGNIAHIRRTVAKEMFKIPEETLAGIFMFTEKAVMDILSEQIPKDAKPN